MRVTFRYHPQYYKEDNIVKSEEDKNFTLTVDLPEGVKAEDILPRLSASGLGIVIADGTVSHYICRGSLQDGGTYYILSADVRETINVMTSGKI